MQIEVEQYLMPSKKAWALPELTIIDHNEVSTRKTFPNFHEKTVQPVPGNPFASESVGPHHFTFNASVKSQLIS